MLEEALYFLKMLCPILLIYSLFKSNLTNETYIKIIKALVLIISLIIVVSNIFMFSYGNYSDTQIKANFFNWFNTDYGYMELASKGLFMYGNQISAVLLMLLPFTIFAVLKNKSTKEKIFNIMVLIFNVWALILLCTRVSVLGIVVVFAYTLFTLVFVRVMDKNKDTIYTLHSAKKYVPIISIFLIYSLLLPMNPMFNRLEERDNVIQTFAEITESSENDTVENSTPVLEGNTGSTIKIETPALADKTEKDETIIYIKNNYKAKQIHEQFLFDNYPYQYDPEFWYNFLQQDISLTTDYRYIETSMIKRVVEINDNPMDFWFGITNTRLQNIFNIEKDFVVQYYALGVIGLVLVFLPYFTLLAYFAYKTIRAKFKNLTLINTLSFITVLFLFGISYFSGNLLNSLSFTIYFAILFKLLYIK